MMKFLIDTYCKICEAFLGTSSLFELTIDTELVLADLLDFSY